MKQSGEKKKAISTKDTLAVEGLEKKFVEISPESQQERMSLAEMFAQGADSLAENDRKRKKEREATIELLDGATTSISQIHARITPDRQPYKPLFPNENSFFTHALRIHGYGHLDPKVYVKPPCIPAFIIRTIYDRFPKSKELLLGLRALNPICPDGYRLYKLYQYVDDQGQAEIERYRDDTTRIMEACTNDYECNKRLYSEYGISYQLDAFKEKGND